MNPPTRRVLDARAYALMAVCCLLWGLQQVAVKVALPDASPVMQGGIRSIIATALLLAWARARSLALFDRDGTLGPGLVAGLPGRLLDPLLDDSSEPH
ncbi:MAG TPA: hypothetical protein VFN64_13995, partial [Burkholderiaceae bacterium]|nr:hypothetical protein [Burkholderiaceae bacterium]